MFRFPSVMSSGYIKEWEWFSVRQTKKQPTSTLTRPTLMSFCLQHKTSNNSLLIHRQCRPASMEHQHCHRPRQQPQLYQTQHLTLEFIPPSLHWFRSRPPFVSTPSAIPTLRSTLPAGRWPWDRFIWLFAQQDWIYHSPLRSGAMLGAGP